MHPVIRAALALVFTAGAFAQDLTPKAPPQKTAVVIKNATLHPISKDPIENGVIVLNDSRIAGVFTTDEFAKFQAMAQWAAPPTIIDAKGLHVYPGLIAPYTQLGLVEIGAVPQSADLNEVGDFTPEVHAASAVNPDSTLLPVTRANGVLTAAIFPEGGSFPGQPSLIRLDAWTVEDTAVEPSLGLLLNWPGMRGFAGFNGERPEADQARDVRAGVEAVTKAFDIAQAYMASKAAPADDKNPAPQPTDLRWEAFRSVLPPPAAPGGAQTKPGVPQRLTFIVANDLDQITAAVAFAAERHLRPVIIGGRDADQCAPLLRAHDVPVIVRGTHNMPDREDAPYDDAYTLPARLHAAGVRFCIASSDRTANERNLPYNAATAVAFGLPHDAALRSITLSAAEVLGVADKLGSLDAGKAATIIVTDGDPLEITTTVRHAFIDGRAVDLTNKQSKLAEKYRDRYRQSGQWKGGDKK